MLLLLRQTPARRSLSTVRVMVITRGAFESIERNFPIASRLVLENLKRRSEGQVGPSCRLLRSMFAFLLALLLCGSSVYLEAAEQLPVHLWIRNQNVKEAADSRRLCRIPWLPVQGTAVL